MMRFRFGDWDFDADSGELFRGSERSRLEPRAARTLQLLAEADGAIVSQERIIAEVWGGRSLSDNSVSVVIGQLRRALDDDARLPKLIETVPKRGYRLISSAVGAEAGTSRTARVRLLLLPVLALVVTAIAGVAWFVAGRDADRPSIAVTQMINETGNAALDPHVRASSELIVNELSRRGFTVLRRSHSTELTLESRLVMWNGEPYLSMTATDPQGVIRWSAMTRGGPAAVPAGVAAEIGKLQAKLAAQ